MGRKIKVAKAEPPRMDWMFKLDVNIQLQGKPRIAFLSGLERTYYPEDPGFSKLAIVYQPDIEANPPCTYVPSTDRLYGKPISKKGYGIGGPYGSRLAPLPRLDNPAPDKYQREVAPQLLYSHRRKIPHDEDVLKWPLRDPWVMRKKYEAYRQKKRQCVVSFLRNKSQDRFNDFNQYPSTLKTAGVGHYNVDIPDQPKSVVNTAFGRSPAIHELSTDLTCLCARSQRCVECGRSLAITDFYRSRLAVRIPEPETRRPHEIGKDFRRGVARVNLCNVCYYRASKGESQNWPKKKLKFMFKKTRICPSPMVHDEDKEGQGVVNNPHGDKNTVRRLQLKESKLARYYKDNVEESIRVRDRDRFHEEEAKEEIFF